jgi:hypothetical protein
VRAAAARRQVTALITRITAPVGFVVSVRNPRRVELMFDNMHKVGPRLLGLTYDTRHAGGVTGTKMYRRRDIYEYYRIGALFCFIEELMCVHMRDEEDKVLGLELAIVDWFKYANREEKN